VAASECDNERVLAGYLILKTQGLCTKSGGVVLRMKRNADRVNQLATDTVLDATTRPIYGRFAKAAAASLSPTAGGG
jgi:hypothetical protein